MTEFNHMVSVVEKWIKKSKIEDRNTFVSTPKEKLVRYHGTLGRDIRNEFKLWDADWTPKIVNGVDCSPNHPEQISMRIIEEVWSRAKNENL